jgi:FtsZ-interacting cell division protein YlmF
VDLVGAAEIAQLMGVARQRVHELARVHLDFPEPVAELSAGRIWQKSEIEAWMASRERPERRLDVKHIAGIAVLSPIAFSDMQTVGDLLRKSDDAFVVELRRVDVVQMRRCIDFFSGAAYVANAEVDRIADRAYLIWPESMPITKAQRREVAASLEQGADRAVKR